MKEMSKQTKYFNRLIYIIASLSFILIGVYSVHMAFIALNLKWYISGTAFIVGGCLCIVEAFRKYPFIIIEFNNDEKY